MGLPASVSHSPKFALKYQYRRRSGSLPPSLAPRTAVSRRKSVTLEDHVVGILPVERGFPVDPDAQTVGIAAMSQFDSPALLG